MDSNIIIEEFTLSECEEFLQRKDISASECHRAVCRRQQLMEMSHQHPQDILSKHPECSFAPVAMVGRSSNWLVGRRIFVIVELLLFCLTGLVLWEWHGWHDGLDISIICLLGLGVFVVMIPTLVVDCMWMVKEDKRCEQFIMQNWFVERHGGKVVKRITDLKKIGLVDWYQRIIILPMEYDELHYDKEKKQWEAKKDGQTIYIRI